MIVYELFLSAAWSKGGNADLPFHHIILHCAVVTGLMAEEEKSINQSIN